MKEQLQGLKGFEDIVNDLQEKVNDNIMRTKALKQSYETLEDLFRLRKRHCQVEVGSDEKRREWPASLLSNSQK